MLFEELEQNADFKISLKSFGIRGGDVACRFVVDIITGDDY